MWLLGHLKKAPAFMGVRLATLTALSGKSAALTCFDVYDVKHRAASIV
jgi:hypothetical protein